MCKKAADAKAQLIEQENQKARVLPRNPRKRSPTVAEAKARHEIDQRRVILKDRNLFRACARQDDREREAEDRAQATRIRDKKESLDEMDLDPSIKDEDLSSSHRGSSLERESDQEMDAFPLISDVRIIPKKKKQTADGVGDVDLSSSSRSSSLGRGGPSTASRSSIGPMPCTCEGREGCLSKFCAKRLANKTRKIIRATMQQDRVVRIKRKMHKTPYDHN